VNLLHKKSEMSNGLRLDTVYIHPNAPGWTISSGTYHSLLYSYIRHARLFSLFPNNDESLFHFCHRALHVVLPKLFTSGIKGISLSKKSCCCCMSMNFLVILYIVVQNKTSPLNERRAFIHLLIIKFRH